MLFDFVGKKFWFFLGSAIIIIAGLISLFLPNGIKWGIEFEGGISVTVSQTNSEKLNQVLNDLGYSDAVVQSLGEGEFFIRLRELSSGEQETLRAELDKIGTVEDFSSVSPILARETVRNAGIAVGAAAVAILLYLLFAFRKMPHPLRYGVCAIIALIHDVLIVLGIFSLLSRAFNWEINPMFVTAVLAVIGYSVNDTVVVFDRIRENLSRGLSRDFGVVTNSSLAQTLTRSINTSLTTFLVVLGVYLFVGSTIQNFTLALLIGIISGTYSSIFIASQFLVVWEKGEWRRFISWLPFLSH
jgi:preprotein translocase subunit SecF